MTTDAPPRPDGRTTKVVRFSREMYLRLYRERQPGETYDDVLRRLFTLHDLAESQTVGN